MEDTIKELATTYTVSTSSRGSALSTSYQLQGVLFLKKIKDAAKKRLYFTQACYVTSAPKGTKDVIIPKRTAYIGNSGTTFTTAEADSDIGLLTIDNLNQSYHIRKPGETESNRRYAPVNALICLSTHIFLDLFAASNFVCILMYQMSVLTANTVLSRS